MEARRRTVTSADGTRIGLVTAGVGPPLLLVHGGMCSSARWAPLWPLLVEQFEVTAMDRRGRGSSADATTYSIDEEYADVAAVLRELAAGAGGPVDVFGHSYGAVCALGAAGGGAAVRRLVLYEPPGPATVPADWLQRVRRLVADGQVGHAMESFLVEVLGLSAAEVERLRVAAAAAAAAAAADRGGAAASVGSEAFLPVASGPDAVGPDAVGPDAVGPDALGEDPAGAHDPVVIAARTMVREAESLRAVDLPWLAGRVDRPALLLLGSHSPAWARQNTEQVLAAMPSATLALLDGEGHEAVDTAPALVAELLQRYLVQAGP